MKKYILLILLIISRLAAYTQIFEIDTISMTGDIDDRINIVFLPDGYQEEELDKFIEDVHWMEDALLDRSPYREYRAYFNSFAIKVPSNVSGAADDPDELIDNYFGSTFNTAGIWRLVTPRRTSRLNSVLRDNFPQFDQVVMIVNDSRYGGSGGWTATSTTHPDGPEICIHEIGHSFAGLSDEYWAGEQYARENINMTQETDPAKVRWKNWLDYRSVGIYQHDESPDWKRPHQNCEMRFLNRSFCPVCQEAIAMKILDETSPVVSYSPAENDFTLTEQEIHFSVDLLEPLPNTLGIKWILNNDSVAGNVKAINLTENEIIPGENKVVVLVLDTTDYIRNSTHCLSHLHKVSWTFNNGASGIEIDKIDRERFSVDIFPNPATDYINLRGNLSNSVNLEIRLLSRDGKQIRIIKQKKHPAGEFYEEIDINRLKLASGLYYVLVSADDHTHNIPIVIE